MTILETTFHLSNGLQLALILGHFSIDPLPEGRTGEFDGSEADDEEADSGVELVLQHVELLRDEESADRGDEHVGTGHASLVVEHGEPFFREETEPDGWSLDRSRASRKVDEIAFGSDVED